MEQLQERKEADAYGSLRVMLRSQVRIAHARATEELMESYGPDLNQSTVKFIPSGERVVYRGVGWALTNPEKVSMVIR